MGEEGKETIFEQLMKDPSEYGAVIKKDLPSLLKRYPSSHAQRLTELLSMSDEDLGRFFQSHPVISQIQLTRDGFFSLNEEVRRPLRSFLERIKTLSQNNEVCNLLNRMSKFELRLFTDGTELLIGILNDNGEEKRKVIRLVYRPTLSRECVIENITRLNGLIPNIIFHIEGNEGLFLIDYVNGREITDEEIVDFKKQLKERGFDPEKFDLNKGNLIVTEEGESILIDIDDILMDTREEFVSTYINETGFPDSANTIRQHLRTAFVNAVAETGIPVVFVGIDMYSSLGNEEGYNNALPGSDVDGIVFFVKRNLNQEEREKFRDCFLKKVRKELVNITSVDFDSRNFISAEELSPFLDSEYKDGLLPSNLYSLIQQIVYGTALFEDLDEELIRRIRDSRLAQTMPKKPSWSHETMTPYKKAKYEARRLLREIFSSLPFLLKFIIIRSHLLYTSRKKEDFIDLSSKGPYVLQLEELYQKGLYYKEEHNGKTYYIPRWIPSETRLFVDLK